MNVFLIFRFKCKRCVNNVQIKLPPEDSDCTSDLSQWYHCTTNKSIPDTVLSNAWDVTKSISFVFHHRSTAEVSATPPVVSSTKTTKKIISQEEYDEDEKDDDVEDDVNDEDFVL